MAEEAERKAIHISPEHHDKALRAAFKRRKEGATIKSIIEELIDNHL